MSTVRFTTAFALGLFSVQLASCVTVETVNCSTPSDQPHRLKFKVRGDECVEKVVKDSDGSDAEEIHVCETDVVEWKVTGKAKSIEFGSASPFSWTDSGFQKTKIEGTVKAGTAGQAFKYSVKVEGLTCVHDPRIIVDH